MVPSAEIVNAIMTQSMCFTATCIVQSVAVNAFRISAIDEQAFHEAVATATVSSLVFIRQKQRHWEYTRRPMRKVLDRQPHDGDEKQSRYDIFTADSQ